MFKIAVIGFGYWAPNIVRNFSNHPECEVKYICDSDSNARKRAKGQYLNIEVTDNLDIIFDDSEIDIIAIITPISTHYPLAKKALDAGKHIFLEKPMTETVAQADELVHMANEKKLIAVVDHTYLFTGAVRKIKQIVESGEIGDITYFDSVRVNLGLFQHDSNVIWDLACHDLSILFHIMDERPISVTANGVDHFNSGYVDVAYLTLDYDDKMIANFHVNWLSPVKVRKILIGGTKKMIVYDDMESSEKIKVYDKGITVNEPEDIHRLLVNYRSGEMVAPNILSTEALELEINNFITQINSDYMGSDNDLKHGRDMVEILEVANQSLIRKERLLL